MQCQQLYICTILREADGKVFFFREVKKSHLPSQPQIPTQPLHQGFLAYLVLKKKKKEAVNFLVWEQSELMSLSHWSFVCVSFLFFIFIFVNKGGKILPL